MVDIEKVIKTTVKKGKIKIGTKETKKAVNDGSAKIVIMSNNCPHAKDISNISKKKKVPIHNTNFNSIELGYNCGKAYAISVFAVLDDGGSNIINLAKK